MKAIIFYSALLISSITALAPLHSCNKGIPAVETGKAEVILTPALPALGKLVQQKETWLHFPSMDAFREAMQDLHDHYGVPDLPRWEAAFPGYVSLRRHYEDIDADTAADRRLPTVDSLINANQLMDCPDSYFATVLSRDGYIQVSDTLYSFGAGRKNGEAYAIPAKYIREVLGGTDPVRLKGTQVHGTSIRYIPFPRWEDHGVITVPEPSDPPIAICDFPSALMPNWWGQLGGDIYGGDNGQTFPLHNGRVVRLNYHRWRVGYVFYASTGVRLKMWKHTRFAGWLSNVDANRMTMEACVKGFILEPTGNTPFQVSTSPGWPGYNRSNTNKFEKTLMWVSNGVFAELLLEHFNFHFRVNYKGHLVERSIRE